MNDPKQKEIHKTVMNGGIDLDCIVEKVEDGYSSMCPICPWTSGIRDYKGLTKILYYRHLDYVIKGE